MNAVEKMEPREVAAASPMSIIQIALEKGTDIATLKELMGLQERHQANMARTAYGEAMAKAQADMRPVSADASNPQTKSKYASYHALDKAIRPIYTRNGFSLSFDTAEGAPPDHIRIVCNVQHVSGHLKTPHLDMPADGKGAKGGDVMTKTHAAGAALTYGRRYLLSMIFNIAVGDDTDGNAPSRKELAGGNQPITPDEFILLRDLIEKTGAVEAKVLEAIGASSLELLTQKQFRESVIRLNNWAKKKAQNGTA